MLTYMETFKIKNTLPKYLRAHENSIPKDQGTSPMWVTPRQEKYPVVARNRYVPPSNVELFAFRLIMLNSNPTSFEDSKTFSGELRDSFRDKAVLARLYINGSEYYTAFEEALRIQCTAQELRIMLVTLFQHGRDPKILIEIHETALTADIIQFNTAEEKNKEIMKRVFKSLTNKEVDC